MAIKITRNIPPFDTTVSDKYMLYISGSVIKFDSVVNIRIRRTLYFNIFIR
jgi:hypothetical protein